MCVRHVGVRMVQRIAVVLRAVRVDGHGHGLMSVIVVPIVMPMGMLALQGPRLVRITMRLDQVQHDACQHLRLKGARVAQGV